MTGHPFCFDPIADIDNQTVTNAGDFTFSAPAGARGFLISVQTAPIFITYDGSSPSSTNGLHIPSGVVPIYIGIAKTFIARSSAASSPTGVLWVR